MQILSLTKDQIVQFTVHNQTVLFTTNTCSQSMRSLPSAEDKLQNSERRKGISGKSPR